MLEWDEKTRALTGGSTPSMITAPRNHAYLIVLAGTNVGEMYKVEDGMVLGRGQEAGVRVVDDGVSRRHAHVRCEGEDCFIEDLGSTNGTFLNGDRVMRSVLKDGDKIRVGSTTILKFTYNDHLDENFQRHMYEAALRDGLTKIFNRKYFIDRLEAEFSFAIRHGATLSLVLFDIDHFKSINDTYGHPAGDAVLVTLARTLNERIRGEDVFARYGGEEFVVICRGTPIHAAQAFAERIRKAVEQTQFQFQQGLIPVTLSAGVASLPDPTIKDPVAFVSAADSALYGAKRAGRNRVMIRPPGSPPPTGP